MNKQINNQQSTFEEEMAYDVQGVVASLHRLAPELPEHLVKKMVMHIVARPDCNLDIYDHPRRYCESIDTKGITKAEVLFGEAKLVKDSKKKGYAGILLNWKKPAAIATLKNSCHEIYLYVPGGKH